MILREKLSQEGKFYIFFTDFCTATLVHSSCNASTVQQQLWYSADATLVQYSCNSGAVVLQLWCSAVPGPL